MPIIAGLVPATDRRKTYRKAAIAAASVAGVVVVVVVAVAAEVDAAVAAVDIGSDSAADIGSDSDAAGVVDAGESRLAHQQRCRHSSYRY